MEEEYFIGVDCGTQSVRVAIYNTDGNLVIQSSSLLKVSTPNLGWSEQNPEEWWISLCKALKNLSKNIKVNKIAGIAIAYQRETFTIIDKAGSIIRPAILWLDQRATFEVKKMKEDLGQDFFLKKTGKFLDTTPSSLKIKWIENNEPEYHKRIYKVLDVGSYLNWKLTGHVTSTLAGADTMGILDIKTKEWSDEILSYLNLTSENMPQLVSSGSVVGKINREAASSTGLPIGLPVIAGGGDGQVFAIGVNSINNSELALSLGTSVVWGLHSEKYSISPYYRTMMGCLPKSYYYESVLRAGTYIIKWFIESMVSKEEQKIAKRLDKNLEDLLDKKIEKIEPGCKGLITIPYWRGGMMPYNDPNSRGLTIGWSDYHTIEHLYKSILEGIAFEIRLVLNGYKKNLDLDIRNIKIGSGGSRSKNFTEIVSDITNTKVIISETSENTSLGAVMIAAWGLGYFKSLSDASIHMYKEKLKITPNIKTHETYNRIFNQVYKKIYPCIKKYLNILGEEVLKS